MTQEEEMRFRREEIALLNLIVKKLVHLEKKIILIESGQSAMERSIFCGITKSTNKTIQKMHTQTVSKIRHENQQMLEKITKPKETVWARLKRKTKLSWSRILQNKTEDN